MTARLLALPLLASLALACGGSADKKIAAPTEEDLEKRRLACAATPPDIQACADMCERGREASCETLKNSCLIDGDAAACFYLGQAYEREGDMTHARGAYSQACRGGQSAACNALGDDGTTEPPGGDAPAADAGATP